MKTLDSIGIRHGTDKSSNGHNFLIHYEKQLENIKNNEVFILEIGVFKGSSLRMWAEYFSLGKIFGIDCPESEGGKQSNMYIEDMRRMETEQIKIFNVDQNNKTALRQFIQDNNNIMFDCIIDDGHHYQDTQQNSLGALFPNLKPGGLYIIEDLQFYKNGHWGIKDMENYTDSTYKILENFNNNQKFKSIFLTDEENEYLENNISKIELLHMSDSDITSFVRKK